MGRASAVSSIILGSILVMATLGPAASATPPPGLDAFKYALGEVESGGNYTARNPYSGAYGKYQIIPSNWPAWARTYLGDSSAPQTPANQERVASGKLTSLYNWLDSWPRVAYWWLTGSSATSGWSSYARSYVDRIMTLYRSGGGAGSTTQTSTVSNVRIHESSRSIEYGGTWALASHDAYAGDRARYATRSGASATITFAGSAVTVYGPTGPTRGRAKVYLDGALIRTVDLYRSSFQPRTAWFSRTWTSTGRHRLSIVVVGTTGRPMVAIDEFVYRP